MTCAAKGHTGRYTSGSQTICPWLTEGSVWVDPQSARVLRIEMQARDLPSDFPTDTVESAVDYSLRIH